MASVEDFPPGTLVTDKLGKVIGRVAESSHVDPGPADLRTAFEKLKSFRAEREANYRKEQYEKEWETLSPAASTIVPLSNGHLECRNSDCGKGIYWCKHIERFVSDGRDARDIWTIVEDLNGLKIQVPYIPTLGQWALVQFGEEHFGSYKLYLVTSSETPLERDNEFLGFIGPGEGRKIMREMVHNWFLPRLNESQTCTATGHSYQAQLEWERMVDMGDPSQKEYLAQCWCVFLRGLCMRCAAADSLAIGDDLVPDVSTAKRSWTR